MVEEGPAHDVVVLLEPKMPDPPPAYLNCPICMDFFYENIFQCREGHVICEDCFRKLRITNAGTSLQCPRCRICMRSDNTRNRALEDIAQQQLIKCKWRDCNVIMYRDDIINHHKDCEHKAMTCGVSDCTWQGYGDEIEKHCMDKHARWIAKKKRNEDVFIFLNAEKWRRIGTRILVLLGAVYFFSWREDDSTHAFRLTSFLDEKTTYRFDIVDGETVYIMQNMTTTMNELSVSDISEGACTDEIVMRSPLNAGSTLKISFI